MIRMIYDPPLFLLIKPDRKIFYIPKTSSDLWEGSLSLRSKRFCRKDESVLSLSDLSLMVCTLCTDLCYWDFLQNTYTQVLFCNLSCIHPHSNYFHHHTVKKIFYHLRKFKGKILQEKNNYILGDTVDTHNNFYSSCIHQSTKHIFSRVTKSTFLLSSNLFDLHQV